MENSNQTPEKKSIGLILSWFFGVLFAVTGLFSLVANPISGIILLVLAFIILPPANKFLKEKANISLSKGIKALTIVILFIVFGAVSPKSLQSPTDQAEKNVAVEDKGSSQEKAVTSSTQSFSDYKVVKTETNEDEGVTTTKITIATPYKDNEKLIGLNDNLAKEYSAKKPFTIEYFDNEEIAKTFWKDLMSFTSSEQINKHLVHLLAEMDSEKKTFNKNPNNGFFNTDQGHWEMLKKY